MVFFRADANSPGAESRDQFLDEAVFCKCDGIVIQGYVWGSEFSLVYDTLFL
jgi:hypothetical protein